MRTPIAYPHKHPMETYEIGMNLGAVLGASETIVVGNSSVSATRWGDDTEDTSADVLGAVSVVGNELRVRLLAGSGAALGRHKIVMEAVTNKPNTYQGTVVLQVGQKSAVGFYTKQAPESFYLVHDFSLDLLDTETITLVDATSADKYTGANTTADLIDGLATIQNATQIAVDLKEDPDESTLGRHIVTLKATTDAGNVYVATVEVLSVRT